jgi:DNA mismatch repair protein MutH
MDAIQENVNELIGQQFPLPLHKSAGWLLETTIGAHILPNAVDGDMKVIQIKRLINGVPVAKSVIHVAILYTNQLALNTYEDSKVFHNLQRILYVPYERNGDTIEYLAPTFIDMSLPQYAHINAAIRTDYETIRERYLTTGEINPLDGVYLSIGRVQGTRYSFYLQKRFANQYLVGLG